MAVVRGSWLMAAGALLSVWAGCSAASAQSPAEFYKGKTVIVVVGFSPGGGYDLYARAVARYLGAHIPGNPKIIVQNMPGAGSLNSLRHVANKAAKDGTVISAFNPGIITLSLTDPGRVKMKLSDFKWLGSITRDFRVCYASVKSGVKSWADLAAGKEFIIGATGQNTSNYVNGAVLRNLFGLKIKQILGFPGSAEMRLAIERGELHGDCGSWSSIDDKAIKEKSINVLVSYSPRKTEDMPEGIPYIGTFAKTDEQKQLLKILTAAGDVGRPYVVNWEVPADRVKALQEAFLKTMADKEFLATAKQQGLPVYPVSGDEAQKILHEIYAFPPDMVAKAKEMMK